MGALVLNRFAVSERLGSGGFGTVYRAWDQRLERDVAVKVIELGGQPVARVLREAQAVARLNHPSVVTLYELGEDGSRAYLVGELVNGASLDELQRDGRLTDRAVGELAVDICDGLAHAHSRGVVHRDIKPQNVMLDSGKGRAKLMDFGIARVLDGAGITATGDVVGTLAYMAPEQAEGEETGPEADVYSLGLTLYEAWSGENPNARATPAATARAIGTAVRPLDELRPDLPLELCDMLDGCLEPEPDLRPPLDELSEAVEGALPELAQEGTVPRPSRRIGAGPLAGYLLAFGVAMLTLLWSRVGYLLGCAGITAWLAGPGARPGTALVFATLAFPPGLLVSGGRWLPLPFASPLLGLAGLGSVFPALAGLAATARDRALLGAAGYAWLALVEAALDRKLLFGPAVDPASGWQASAGAAARELLLPMLVDPVFVLGIAFWSLGAVALGIMVRGRNPALDLLGALVWAAALVAVLRLDADAAGPPAGVVAAAVLAVVGAAIVLRGREGEEPAAAVLGHPRGPLQEASREATLP